MTNYVCMYVDMKVHDLGKTVGGKFVMMEENINSLRSQRPDLVRVVSEDTR